MDINISKALRSQFGASYHVGKFPELEKISTKLIGLDLMLGGGLPVGRIMQIWGGSSSCKTTVCLHLAKALQEQGYDTAFVDAERTLEGDRLDQLGIDSERFHRLRPSCGEEALSFAVTAAEAGVKLIIIDSVPFLNTKAAAESDIGQVQMAPQARLLAAEMPKLVPAIEHNGAILIFINQERSKIGGYGPSTSLPGGNALKFMCTMIIKLHRAEVLKDGTGGTGLRIGAQTTKNKVFPEGKSCQFSVMFPGAVIDYESSMKEVIEQHGLLKKSGSFYKFNEELQAELGVTGNIGQGGKRVCNYLRENPAVYNMLYQRMLNTLNKAESVGELEEVDPDA